MSPPHPTPPLSVWSISTFACQQEIFPKTWEHISNLDRELRRISLNKISIQQCWLLGEELETKRLLTARVEIQCLNLNSKKVYYNDVSQMCLSRSSLISIKIFQIVKSFCYATWNIYRREKRIRRKSKRLNLYVFRRCCNFWIEETNIHDPRDVRLFTIGVPRRGLNASRPLARN